MMTKKQGIQKKVIEYIKKHELIQEEERVVLGLSGGADSVCMLLLLTAMQKEIRRRSNKQKQHRKDNGKTWQYPVRNQKTR